MSVRLDHGEDSLNEVHEINVTPFIDVMLVLLIIFMVAAPLATVDVAVNLPSSTAEPQPRPDKPVFLTVKADYSLVLGEATIARETLGSALGGSCRRHVQHQSAQRAVRRAARGAFSRKSRKVFRPSANRMVMKPPPPRLPAAG